MTLIEFLSLGLEAGQRVILTVNDFSSNTHSVDCHFNGYRIFAGKTRAYSPKDIVPVFHFTSKNGKMLNKRIHEFTMLENILQVDTSSRSFKDYNLPEDLKSLMKADENISTTCSNILMNVLKEMSILFPGKKVHFDLESDRVGVVAYFMHFQEVMDVRALCYRDGHIRYDLTGENGSEDGLEDGEVDNFSIPYLLVTLLKNIRTPYVPERCEDNFFDPARQTWRDIPDTDSESTPYLHMVEALGELKADSWYASLSNEEKEKFFEEYRTQYESNKEEHPENTQPFWWFINVKWNTLETRWKLFHLNRWIRKQKENGTEK